MTSGRLARLTEQEREALRLVPTHGTIIALGISESTVKLRLGSTAKKRGVVGRHDAARLPMYRHRRRIAAYHIPPSWSSFDHHSGSRNNDLAVKEKCGVGDASKRISRNGRVEALPRTSNGGMQ